MYCYSKHNQRDDRNLLILKLVIAGAFYPNYFRWGVADEEQAIRDMSGHDPLTTVMVGVAMGGARMLILKWLFISIGK